MTGANGLLGFHSRAALFAENCAAKFNGKASRYTLIDSPRLSVDTLDWWSEALKTADLVLHLAGINRAENDELEFGNRDIAELLVRALTESNSKAHVVYANSTHTGSDSPYGRGKQAAHQLLEDWSKSRSTPYTNFVLPHIFGEKALPHYNNVTSTLCHQIVAGEKPTIHDGAAVELLHAGRVIDAMLSAYESAQVGFVRMTGRSMSVSNLYDALQGFRTGSDSNTYPDLSDDFIARLYNTYRTVEYPSCFPKFLDLHSDERGTLFEAVKGGGGGQTFMSWTEPGIERGNHFHRTKVERFLVVSGKAEIRIRPLFEERVDTYTVSGENPAYVDIPTLHTHSIVNVGEEPLLTLFWAHEVFDPESPDTYAHPVTEH